MTEHRHNRVEPSTGGGQDQAGDSSVDLDRDTRQPESALAGHLGRMLDRCSRPAGDRIRILHSSSRCGDGEDNG
jgi:hypothetical protein